MMGLKAIGIAVATVLGVACGGIGVISIVASNMSDNAGAGDRAFRSGCGLVSGGMILLAIASGMAWL
jgi:hypothetical protein